MLNPSQLTALANLGNLGQLSAQISQLLPQFQKYLANAKAKPTEPPPPPLSTSSTEKEKKTKRKRATKEDEANEERNKKPKPNYCICDRSSDGKFMVGCDICDNWYHPECVEISKKLAKSLDYYICPYCAPFISADDTAEVSLLFIYCLFDW